MIGVTIHFITEYDVHIRSDNDNIPESKYDTNTVDEYEEYIDPGISTRTDYDNDEIKYNIKLYSKLKSQVCLNEKEAKRWIILFLSDWRNAIPPVWGRFRYNPFGWMFREVFIRERQEFIDNVYNNVKHYRLDKFIGKIMEYWREDATRHKYKYYESSIILFDTNVNNNIKSTPKELDLDTDSEEELNKYIGTDIYDEEEIEEIEDKNV